MAAITSTNVANAIVKLVAADALPVLVGNLVMGNLVNRDYQDNPVSRGYQESPEAHRLKDRSREACNPKVRSRGGHLRRGTPMYRLHSRPTAQHLLRANVPSYSGTSRAVLE